VATVSRQLRVAPPRLVGRTAEQNERARRALAALYLDYLASSPAGSSASEGRTAS